MKVLNFLKAHWKGALFALYLILCVVLTIGSLIWTDYAEKSFWWTFWDISFWIGLVGFVGGIWWFNKQKNINW